LRNDHPLAIVNGPDTVVTKPIDAGPELLAAHANSSDKQLTSRRKEEESGVTALTQVISVGTAELHNLPLRQAK
jgi:hypothetical protein